MPVLTHDSAPVTEFLKRCRAEDARVMLDVLTEPRERSLSLRELIELTRTESE